MTRKNSNTQLRYKITYTRNKHIKKILTSRVNR